MWLVADGSTILLCKDHWNGVTPARIYPELLSFARNRDITFRMAVNAEDFSHLFSLPLSVEAHQQLLSLQEPAASKFAGACPQFSKPEWSGSVEVQVG
jgi:hypothetical protein